MVIRVGFNGEAGLRRAMLTTFGADGGVFSRAPMDQFHAIAVLSVLRSLYDQSEEADLPEAIRDALDMAMAAFQGVTHHDGSMAGWQGASALNAETLEHLVNASGIIARPLRQARYWGYQRITAGRSGGACRCRAAADCPPCRNRLRLNARL